MEDFEQDLQKIEDKQVKIDETIRDIKWKLIDVKKEIRKNRIVMETIDYKLQREKNRRKRKERAEQRVKKWKAELVEAVFWGAMAGIAIITLFGILA